MTSKPCFRSLLAGAILLAVASACTGPARAPVTEDERRVYHAARSQSESDPEAARRGLESFIATYPSSGLVPSAQLKLAEIARAQGNDQAALERYYALLRDHPRSEHADAARIEAAKLELARDNPDAATAVLARVRTSRLPDDQKREVYRTFASAVEDPVAKLRWLARLRPLEAADRVADVDAEMDALIFQLDEQALDRAIDQIGQEIPAARLYLRRASAKLAEGDVEAAEKAWSRAASLPKLEATQRDFEAIGERIRVREAMPGGVLHLPTFADAQRQPLPSTAGAQGTIGVVLPLSGKFAHFGNEALKGVLLAAGVFDAGSQSLGRANVKLVVRDTEGRAERAAAAVSELAQDPKLMAVVGPLLTTEAEAAAAAAEVAGLPLIALTARPEVAQGRPHVFRVRTQPREEVQVLVDHAVNELGAQRFAILYPRDGYGRGLRALFWDAVEAQGGSVVAVASYDPSATDFATPILNLVGYRLIGREQLDVIKLREEMRRKANRSTPAKATELRLAARALLGPGGEPLPPIVDFDALFIPESHEKVVLIAPQLAFHEVTGMQLLGASGWYDDSLVRLGRDHVEGAVLTSHYFDASPVPFVQDFTRRSVATFGGEPDALTALAYDAANMVVVQFAKGRNSREALRDGLLEYQAYPGASGVMRMTPDGNAQKRPFLLGIGRNGMQQLD